MQEVSIISGISSGYRIPRWEKMMNGDDIFFEIYLLHRIFIMIFPFFHFNGKVCILVRVLV